MMDLRRPVDAGVPLSLIGHAFSPFEHTSHRDLRRSLYWRSENDFAETVEESVRARALTALAVGIGVGVLFGMALRR
jgi:hypothetical protein